MGNSFRELSEFLGIEYPIFAFSHCRDVVVEVSKAGGLGVLGAGFFGPEQLKQELSSYPSSSENGWKRGTLVCYGSKRTLMRSAAARCLSNCRRSWCES